MSKFVIVVFPSGTQAYDGMRALNDLHVEGSLSVYGMAVLSKDAQGRLSINEAAEAGPLGMAVGALVGALVGLIGGPASVLAGAAGGTAIGSVVDLFGYGVGVDFVSKVAAELAPGKTAIVAEIAEHWTAPLDTRMEALGGTVLRTWRDDFEDEQTAREIAASEADLEQLRAEYAQATADAKARLETKVVQAKVNLERAQQRLETRLGTLEREANAKIAALEQQVAKARADARETIKQRIAALRADYDVRSAKLKQAWTLTKEALAR
jgi:uncharacterized membrane protein